MSTSIPDPPVGGRAYEVIWPAPPQRPGGGTVNRLPDDPVSDLAERRHRLTNSDPEDRPMMPIDLLICSICEEPIALEQASVPRHDGFAHEACDFAQWDAMCGTEATG